MKNDIRFNDWTTRYPKALEKKEKIILLVEHF